MRQHSNLAKDTAEKVVKDFAGRHASSIRRRKRSGSFWKACAARTASPRCAAARVSRRTCTIAGRRTSWRLARSAWPVTRLVPTVRPVIRSQRSWTGPARLVPLQERAVLIAAPVLPLGDFRLNFRQSNCARTKDDSLATSAKLHAVLRNRDLVGPVFQFLSQSIQSSPKFFRRINALSRFL